MNTTTANNNNNNSSSNSNDDEDDYMSDALLQKADDIAQQLKRQADTVNDYRKRRSSPTLAECHWIADGAPVGGRRSARRRRRTRRDRTGR